MNIVFAINQDYVTHCAVAIQSILAHNREVALKFYILIDRISPKKEQLLQTFQSDLVSVNIFQIEDGYFKEFRAKEYVTRATFYRLLIPDLVPDSKALYLDADTVVNGPIYELYNSDLDDFILAAAEDSLGCYLNWYRFSCPQYFNAGVLLLNLDECRRRDLTGRSIDYLRNHPGSEDQQALNAVVGKCWKVIPPKYNLVSSHLRRMSLYADELPASLRRELEEAIEKPVIIHYNGAYKPWLYFSKHPYRHLYWQYLKMTPFYHPLNTDILKDNLRLFGYIVHRRFRRWIDGIHLHR
ncbi:MAG: glycosyltransferase family 8 protein [Gloeomargarita sp. GXS_bins_116]